jgi:CRISPR-associated protein Cmr6
MPSATVDLYRQLRQAQAGAHPAYALSKMVAWHEGWKRTGDKKAPSANAYAYDMARRELEAKSFHSLAECVRARREAWILPLQRAGLAQRLVLTARSDAIVWLVSPGPLELGLALHHIYGFPILPGSSLKGLARRVARGEGGTAADVRYGNQGTAGPIAILDGLPCSDWKVQRDVMTPHFGKWYRGEKPFPDDTEDPVPIPFLSIAAGSRFEVALLARDAGAVAILTSVTEDLRQGLDERGLGAKTAAGYGVFGVEVPPHQRGAASAASASEQVAVSEERAQKPPRVPLRSPRIQEAETLIRLLKPHEVKGRIQAVAAAISKCPAEERDALMECFRKHQEALQFKAREIRANMESLAQRLQGPTRGEG